MKPTAFDGDEILTEFLTRYIDGNMDKAESSAFEDYLEANKPEKEFARNSSAGKKLLSRLAQKKVKASKGFEERLALRIALEKNSQPTDLVNY